MVTSSAIGLLPNGGQFVAGLRTESNQKHLLHGRFFCAQKWAKVVINMVVEAKRIFNINERSHARIFVLHGTHSQGISIFKDENHPSVLEVKRELDRAVNSTPHGETILIEAKEIILKRDQSASRFCKTERVVVNSAHTT